MKAENPFTGLIVFLGYMAAFAVVMALVHGMPR